MSLFEEILSGVQKNVFALCPTRWGSSANTEIPIELSHFIRHTRLDLPDKEERLTMVNNFVLLYAAHPDYREALSAIGEREIESLADALGGMSRLKIEDTLSMSLVKDASLDIPFVLSEKSKAIKEAGFTLKHPSSGFESIGGLTPLKEWISMISGRFTTAAKEYGFTRNLRGLLLCGVPGCGKTAIAKAAAHEMNMNLMMVQAPDLKGSLVGESEAKVHRLLDIAKAAAPLIVFVDEAEKLLGKSEGIHDGGAHDAVLGQFLTFMQEDDSGVFFVFTANNMEKFPPELVDRFEGRFFIDLPQPAEREDIINIHLSNRRFGQQDPEHFDVPELIRLTNKFSGRNIEDAIEEAMTMSFRDNMRPLEQADLKQVFQRVVPTSETKKDEIDGMRRYAEDGLVRVANDMPEDEVRSKASPTTRVRI
jgi:SpoVK/Ycf46/Vps4 family AAA+-type ATPase